MKPEPYVLLVLTGAAVLSGCGSGDGPTDPGGGGGGGGGTAIENPSFAGDINPLFLARGCTAALCHGGGEGGLTLGAGAPANYAALVDVPSTQEPAFVRVKPGDAQNSYLVVKLEGRQTVGGRMPLDGGALGNVELTNIRNWIGRGALNN